VNEFHFAEPQWVHGLWGVLVFVALLFWLDRRGSGAIDRLISKPLQDRMVKRSSGARRKLRILFVGLSVACLVIALMRPQLGIRHVAAPRVGAEIMVALDVSKSMLAEDVAPNRLDRAKAEIVDLLPYLEGDQVGLIAFAGRATVLAPMTPDFSFLRMVLDGAGSHSVSRGGTRLEEPIRKAVQGFGPVREASRVLLLITDGEDQGSFPRDAAAEAAEAGVVIIAIGFGDEQGSEVVITDPRTGAREALRDSDGNLVRSRLDGEMLRDLALATQGAYVPAGTGVLDLESIYRQHIERLMLGKLDPRGQTVRDEGYQWMVLLSLVLLISSVAVSSGTKTAWGAVLLLTVLTAPAPPVHAQEASETPSSEEAAEPAAPDTEVEAAPKPEDPREIYNRGVSALETEAFDEALREFEAARRAAGSDGELRFRSAYNLGLGHVGRATELLAESPEEALRAFYTAADWFRDAITQRPDHEDSRVNLEVVLRRALALADRIAKQNEKGVDAELAALAEQQRALVGGLAALHDRVAGETDVASEARRREFRARAADQRVLLSEGDRLAGAIREDGAGATPAATETE